MDDRVGPLAREEPLHPFAGSAIEPGKGESGLRLPPRPPAASREREQGKGEPGLRPQPRQPGSLLSDVVVLAEIVEPDDLVAPAPPSHRRVVAGEARGAGAQTHSP